MVWEWEEWLGGGAAEEKGRGWGEGAGVGGGLGEREGEVGEREGEVGGGRGRWGRWVDVIRVLVRYSCQR